MNSTVRPLARHFSTLRRLATAGAWFFIAFSLAHLAWVIWTKWADPSGVTKLYDAWGLSYTGMLGLLTAMGQATVVLAAVVATVLPGARHLTWRRLGHGLLCGWAGLWAFDFVGLAASDGGIFGLALAFLGCVFLACTIGRAAMGWRWRRGASPPGGSNAPGPRRDPEFDRALQSGLIPTPPPEPRPAHKEHASARAPVARGAAALWSRTASLLAAAWRAVRRSDRSRHAWAALRRWAAAALAWVARGLGGLADRVTPAPAAPRTHPGAPGAKARA